MKYKYFIIVILILWTNSFIINAEENEYGVVNAWFDEKNASFVTVEGVKLKVGEPVEVKVELVSRINGHVFVKLKEPGVTKSFDISGPSKMDETIDNYDVTSGWSKTYTWTITPNGAWKNGNSPINIFVQYDKIVNGKIKGEKIIQFTIANPYILDEQYTGAASKPITTSTSTGTSQSTPVKETPFLPVIFTVGALLFAWRWRRGKILK